MMIEETTEKNVKTYLKCFMLVFLFWIVAMPPVGLYLIVTRKNKVGKILGWLLLLIGMASWTYFTLYMIRHS